MQMFLALALSAASMCLVSAKTTRPVRPHIVVAVSGELRAELSDALAEEIKQALVGTGRYSKLDLEHDSRFTAQLKRTRAQAKGDVSDNKIMDMAKKARADYICFAKIAPALDSSHQITEVPDSNQITPAFDSSQQITARLIKLNGITGSMRAEGKASGALTNLGEITDISKRIVDNMMNGLSSGGGAKQGEDSVSFTDPRDGQVYRTVKIRNIVWMAENLNYKTGKSWCYGNDESNCKEYGRLYDWNTAKKACPDGWRLPDPLEWKDLVQAAVGSGVAGKKLKSTSGWNNNGNGTDSLGFSAMPGGYRGGGFYDAGNFGGWWSATERGSVYADYRGMGYYYNYVNEHYYNKKYGLSARCVKND
jgi:uncharacterized protein (TIGR02145 family)